MCVTKSIDTQLPSWICCTVLDWCTFTHTFTAVSTKNICWIKQNDWLDSMVQFLNCSIIAKIVFANSAWTDTTRYREKFWVHSKNKSGIKKGKTRIDDIHLILKQSLICSMIMQSHYQITLPGASVFIITNKLYYVMLSHMVMDVCFQS